MKKTILSLAILSCMGIAQAEYFIHLPVDVTFIKGDGQTTSPVENPEIDCSTQSEQYPEQCAEELAAWEQFATDNGLVFDENWNEIKWESQALSALPTSPYPNSNVFNGINLYNNNLTSIEGFKSLNSVGTNLYLYRNNLNNISGLMNLQSVGGSLFLQNNKLSNVNELSNLSYVGGSIMLIENQITDVTGLSNAEVIRNIYIDKAYAGEKLPADTRFCLLNSGPKFVTGYAKKSQICEPGSDTWEFFAFDKGLEYGEDWNSIGWSNAGLTVIPTEPYPNPNPTASISLNANKIQNIDGLIGLTSVGASLFLQDNGLYNIDGLQDLTNVSGNLFLNNNNLTNIDALANLTNVGSSLMLYGNQLTNLNGLSNLTYVGDILDVKSNPINDVSGLSNVNVKGSVKIDSNYSGPKLLSETTFCTLNPATKFTTGYAQKSQICEPGSDTWESFAFEKGLTYGTDWNSFDWRGRNLTVLPTELYPNSNPTSNIYLSSNQLQNIDSLYSLQTVGGSTGHLYLDTNKLTDINGLLNLTSVGGNLMVHKNQLTNLDSLAKLTNIGGSFYAYDNQLSNVNGLSNLQTIGGNLTIYNNAITEISGLLNVNVTGTISIDSTYSGPKMAADSRFCTLNSASKFSSGYAQKSQICEEGTVTWASFAFDKALTYGTNWNSISWGARSLTSIPTEPYPNANPTSYINLNNNQITDIEGLSSLNTVGSNLQLYSNKLTNLNGLRNLTSVNGLFSLYSNNIENLNGLSNLTTVNSSFLAYTNALTNVNGLSNLMTVNGNMELYNNQITDITGLSNANISGYIKIDSTYSGPKMAADSRFCTLNSASKFSSGYAQKSQVCEEGTVTWASFAFDKGLTYATNWNSISWNSKSLTSIPTDLYPNANPTSYIFLHANQLTDVEGLSSLNTIGSAFYLNSNKLTSLNGLRNLTSVNGAFSAYSNALTNVNGLSNLMTVNGNMELYNNQITDMTGLLNAVISSYIKIDATYNGPKMAADSRFCSLNPAYRFSSGYAQKSQLCEEGTVTWASFAFDKGLPYDTNWNSINWGNKALTSIPTDLYPNATPTSYIFLHANQLTDVEGLSSLNTIGSVLYLYSNKLTSLNGLRNLTSVNGAFSAYSNALTNVNALSNLMTVNGYMYLYDNQITDITGLSNANISSYIKIDATYNGPKMAADSRFCTLNSASKFSSGYAQKSQLCEEGTVTWASFAFDKGLPYDTNWNSINWASKSLTSVPTDLYPNANPTSYIFLYSNQLTDVEGLSSLNTVGNALYLNANQLTSLNGLRNLTSVNNNLFAYSNKLTNVNALSNLMTVGGSMYLYDNQITDITGLSNAVVSGYIRIDSTYSGPKMLASSRFCTLNADSRFSSGYAQKSQLCEI